MNKFIKSIYLTPFKNFDKIIFRVNHLQTHLKLFTLFNNRSFVSAFDINVLFLDDQQDGILKFCCRTSKIYIIILEFMI